MAPSASQTPLLTRRNDFVTVTHLSDPISIKEPIMSENGAENEKDWLQAELEDSLDEDYEIELEDAVLSLEIKKIYQQKHGETMPRQDYFRRLLHLQSELIKLQDWVVAHKKKIVVIFEGRDSAGKGGAIKRITQRLNPRVVRVVALPAPYDREKTQWYFQRYIAHFPLAVKSYCWTVPGTTGPGSSV